MGLVCARLIWPARWVSLFPIGSRPRATAGIHVHKRTPARYADVGLAVEAEVTIGTMGVVIGRAP